MPLTSPIRYLAPFVLLLSACGGGGGGGSASPPDGGGTPDPADETPVQILSRINCNAAAEGPVAGPLDQAQAALVAQTAENLGSNAQIGASGEAFVVAVSRLLDLVDALAASGSTLAAEQGVTAVLHHHAASFVEFEDEIERTLGALGDHVGLCVDTGHAAYAGLDPALLVERWGS
ncbi:sugar phosphate isomerase/epimerase family protein, partial [Algiphilus sp.]|uniref:sugar phosphate isomerase/epimerase family protein n=1 Tax=Algiphilus sp. TaxID=1872431 RepID=UPI003C3BA65A